MDTGPRVLVLGLSLLLTSASPTALAHGDVHEQIERLTAEIGKDPRNAALHLRRGELFRVHQEFEKALADLDRAAALDPALLAVELSRGRTLLEAGRPQDARAALDRYVAKRPDDPEGLLWRGRAFAKLGTPPRAIADYDHTLKLAPRSAPEVYAERAELQVASGRLDDALAGLEAGLAVFGAGGVLELKALDVELALGRTDAALARLDRLTASARRKETYLARRAAILEGAGRSDEARAAWASAREALDALPASLRSSRAMAELSAKIEAGLARSTSTERAETKKDTRT